MATNRNKKWMNANEVSKVLQVTKKDMHSFEAEGLFDYVDKTKKKIDSKNFERLKVALSLKRELGVNAAGIDVILNMREKMSRMQREFNTLLGTVRQRLGRRLDANLEKIRNKN